MSSKKCKSLRPFPGTKKTPQEEFMGKGFKTIQLIKLANALAASDKGSC